MLFSSGLPNEIMRLVNNYVFLLFPVSPGTDGGVTLEACRVSVYFTLLACLTALAIINYYRSLQQKKKKNTTGHVHKSNIYIIKYA